MELYCLNHWHSTMGRKQTGCSDFNIALFFATCGWERIGKVVSLNKSEYRKKSIWCYFSYIGMAG